jgi:creatinine amidohydrolase
MSSSVGRHILYLGGILADTFSMLSSDSSFAQVEASGRTGAILPIGALEQHGRHLALGTDTFIAAALAQKVAEAFDWFLLPPLPFGTSREHLNFPGTVTLTPGTLAAVVRDVAESLRGQGFRTLVVLTGHGGNWILKPTVREINLTAAGGGTRVLLVDPEIFYYPLVDRPGLHHGGEYETAMMLHLRSQGVQMHLAAGAEPVMPRTLLDYVPLRKVLPGGVWGAPERATAELGKKWFEQAVQHCIEHVRTLLETLAEIDRKP